MKILRYLSRDILTHMMAVSLVLPVMLYRLPTRAPERVTWNCAMPILDRYVGFTVLKSILLALAIIVGLGPLASTSEVVVMGSGRCAYATQGGLGFLLFLFFWQQYQLCPR